MSLHRENTTTVNMVVYVLYYSIVQMDVVWAVFYYLVSSGCKLYRSRSWVDCKTKANLTERICAKHFYMTHKETWVRTLNRDRQSERENVGDAVPASCPQPRQQWQLKLDTYTKGYLCITFSWVILKNHSMWEWDASVIDHAENSYISAKPWWEEKSLECQKSLWYRCN